jgi:zinc-ribbon domain
MFCPKCGTENPDDGKFCRSCGANLIHVLAVVDGNTPELPTNKNEIAEIYGTGIRNLILGFGFALTTFLVKSMPGDTYFWMLFVIPAFCLLASGISRIVKAEELKKNKNATPIYIPTLPANQANKQLPPNKTEYIKPKNSIYKTDDLVEQPISVTENTTKLLKIEEGE